MAVRVEALWSYPVKSMVGVRVDEVEVGELGIVGDRRFAVRDLARGGIEGGRRLPDLTRCSAVWDDDGEARITVPDGRVVRSDDPAVHEVLSELLGTPVRLEALPAPGAVDHFRRGAPVHDDLEDELRDVFGREPGEPLPDLAEFPPEIIEFASPPGTHHDVWPLMVMTTAALEALTAALPDSVVDVRRFRPSIVLALDGDTVAAAGAEGGPPGHPELGWDGRRLALGEVEIEVVGGCPRCTMVTRAVADEVPADRAVLRHVVKDLGQDVGAYARVLRPGRIRVGDPVGDV